MLAWLGCCCCCWLDLLPSPSCCCCWSWMPPARPTVSLPPLGGAACAAAAAAPRLPLECAGVGAGKGEAADCSTIPDQQPQIAENRRSAKLSAKSCRSNPPAAEGAAPLCCFGDSFILVGFTCSISDQGEAALLQVEASVSVNSGGRTAQCAD